MNNDRRKKLRSIAERLEAIAQELTKIEDEERDAFQRRPVSSQYSESGFNSDEAAEKIQDIASTISAAACELSYLPSDH